MSYYGADLDPIEAVSSFDDPGPVRGSRTRGL